MKMIYENHGKWNQKFEGKYQSNIRQFVWEKINLLDTDEIFTVIADGTETQSNYFASIMVFDSNNKDCLKNSHPLRSKVIKVLSDKMKNLSLDSSTYKLF